MKITDVIDNEKKRVNYEAEDLKMEYYGAGSGILLVLIVFVEYGPVAGVSTLAGMTVFFTSLNLLLSRLDKLSELLKKD